MDIRESLTRDRSADEETAIALLTAGGDARIVLDSGTRLNRYFSSPYPRDVMAYASSTANDISADAFAHVVEVLTRPAQDYADALEDLRAKVRECYELANECAVVMAASGTDLEYVALAAVTGRAAGGVHNILLGADEVGSGCIHSAHGHYFAEQTALGVVTTVGQGVVGLEAVSLTDVAIRCGNGQALSSAEIEAALHSAISDAQAQDRHALVHVVHGSKTGLVLPDLDGIDRLRGEFGDGVSFVVDACQARITGAALRDYLARGAMVFVTGSKFMGGPPFSGFALLPPSMLARAPELPQGMATVFNRAEWPAEWPGRDILPDGTNSGLRLRLEASLFELARFNQLAMPAVERVIHAFEAAIERELTTPLGLRLVQPYAPGESAEADSHPIEMRTLATLDVSCVPGLRTFDDAQALHRRMALAGLRLGQPVKCVRLAEGGWGGTLRIGLSMPQVTAIADLDDGALAERFGADMKRVAAALSA